VRLSKRAINRAKLRWISLSFVVLAVPLIATIAGAAPSFANDKFRELWQYSDKLVDEGPGAGRGYTWGPNSFAVLQMVKPTRNTGLLVIPHWLLPNAKSQL